jgi:hypothetical protein
MISYMTKVLSQSIGIANCFGIPSFLLKVKDRFSKAQFFLNI